MQKGGFKKEPHFQPMLLYLWMLLLFFSLSLSYIALADIGDTSSYPGRTCRQILIGRDTPPPDGVYWIDPDGDGNPSQVYCDMTNGGWMLLDNFVSTLSGDSDPYGYALGNSNIRGQVDLVNDGYTVYLTHYESTSYHREPGYLQMFYSGSPIGYIQKLLPDFADEVRVKWGNWHSGTATLKIGGSVVQTLGANYGAAEYVGPYKRGGDTIRFEENGIFWAGEIWVRENITGSPDYYQIKIWQGTSTSVSSTIVDWTTVCDTNPSDDTGDYSSGFSCTYDIGNATSPRFCPVEGDYYFQWRFYDSDGGTYSYSYTGANNTWVDCEGSTCTPVGVFMYNINYDGDPNDCACKVGTGRYNVGGDISGCCGDDAGENYLTRVASSTMDNGYSSSSSDDACCDANTDCVDDSTCTASGSRRDADGDGDLDYCDAGTWYDCNNYTDCAYNGGYMLCSSGDCVACTQNSDCPSGYYCGSDGACHAKKSTGGTCDWSVTKTGSSTESNGVCQSGYCRDDYDDANSNGNGLCESQESCWCVDSSTDCATDGLSINNGAYAPNDCISTGSGTTPGERAQCSSGSWIAVSCGYSSYNGCSGPCQKTRDVFYCSNTDNSCYDSGTDDVSTLSTAGKVCYNGNEVSPNSTVHCDTTINCVSGTCYATRYYRGCAAGSTSCTDTGRVQYSNFYASANTVISETTYKVGTACTTDNSFCGYGSWSCTGAGSPNTCQRERTVYRCDGSGSCTYNAGTEIRNISAGYVCSNGDEVAGSSNYYSSSGEANRCSAPTSPELGLGDPEYDVFACDGQGGAKGPDVGDKTINCNGCCYDNGTNALCVPPPDYNSLDYFNFGVADENAPDFCAGDADLRDCYNNDDCAPGYACISYQCTNSYWIFQVEITSSNQVFTFVADNANFTVDWGDGNDSWKVEGNQVVSHEYASPGVYNIALAGNATRVAFCGGTGDFSCGSATPELLKDIITPIPKRFGLTNASKMFMGITVSNFSVQNFFDEASGNIIDMTHMFQNASNFNQDLSGWNTSNVINMSYMFYYAQKFDQNIGKWNISHVKDMSYMFHGVTLSTSVYDSILIGWANQSPNIQNNVIFDAGNSKYSLNAVSARNDTLIGIHSWTIIDGGKWQCTQNSDCDPGYFCNLSQDCQPKLADGSICKGVTYEGTATSEDEACLSGYCDNDGVGAADDNWCFTPYNTYFDGQENTKCEYSAAPISISSDEKTANACDGSNGWINGSCYYFNNGDDNEQTCDCIVDVGMYYSEGTGEQRCCGDDGTLDSFCAGGSWYCYEGNKTSDGDVSADACACFNDAWLSNGIGLESPCCGDDGNDEYFEQLESTGAACCFNGTVLESGNYTGAILCYNGQLYDCNNHYSLGGIDTDVANCEEASNSGFYCNGNGYPSYWEYGIPTGCSGCQQNSDCADQDSFCDAENGAVEPLYGLIIDDNKCFKCTTCGAGALRCSDQNLLCQYDCSADPECDDTAPDHCVNSSSSDIYCDGGCLARDRDEAEGYCTKGDGDCHQYHWAVGGENSSFGEYATGSETACCGDDPGEFFINSSFSGNYYSACCDSNTDCVNNLSQCVANGSMYEGYYCDNQSWDYIPVLTTPPHINNSHPYTNDILKCENGTYYDADGDPQLPSNFKWYLNGVEIPGETSQTLNLSKAGNGDKHDNISCAEQPRNAKAEGIFYMSENVTILNSPPTEPHLISPANNNNSIITRTPTFNWTASSDADGDQIIYTLYLNRTSCPYPNYCSASNPLIFGSLTSNSYTTSTLLDIAPYHWKVQACDSESACSNWSEVWNFTIQPYVDVQLVYSTTNFGILAPGQSKNTSLYNPGDVNGPFLIRNNGNCYVNVSINATPLFSSVGMNTPYYQYKIDEYNESNSYDSSCTTITWDYLDTIPKPAICGLDFRDDRDEAEIDLLVEVPSAEPPGAKQSNITISAVMN